MKNLNSKSLNDLKIRYKKIEQSKKFYKQVLFGEDPASQCLRYSLINKQLPSVLIILFQKFEQKKYVPKSTVLRNDIQIAIDSILRLEGYESRRSKYYKVESKTIIESLEGVPRIEVKRAKDPQANLDEQGYRRYLHYNIYELNSILMKTPIVVGAGFEVYNNILPEIGRQISEDKILTIWNSSLIKFSRLELKNLPKIRFYPVSVDILNAELSGSGAFEILDTKMNDGVARKYLTYGLFYYLQKLIHGNFGRPRKCPHCKDWFLASRRNHIFCNIKHKDAFDANTPAGRIRSKKASKKYRDRLKKLGFRHPR